MMHINPGRPDRTVEAYGGWVASGGGIEAWGWSSYGATKRWQQMRRERPLRQLEWRQDGEVRVEKNLATAEPLPNLS